MFEQCSKVSVPSGTTVRIETNRIDVRPNLVGDEVSGGGEMNAGTLEAARLRHPAGSRLPQRAAVPVRPALRLVQAPGEPVAAVAQSGPAVRLTRRGRGVLFGGLLGAMFVAGLASGAHALGADSRGVVPVVRHTMVVQPGQTLWQIARALDPGADPRDTVQRIVDANALRGAEIEAGRTLVLP
jgi:nucleoid-associated protein YgaU